MITRQSAMRTRCLLLGLLLLVATLPVAAFDLCRFEATRSATVDAGGAKSVLVRAGPGDLVVRPAEGNSLVAAGKACASTEKILRETNLRVQREGDVVHVDVLLPDQMVGIGLFHAALDLTVSVPSGLVVEVVDSSGDVHASGVRLAKLTDSSGDVMLRDLLGDLEVSDSSGDLTVRNQAGRVQLRDSSGDIVVAGASDVVVSSDSSGDIQIDRVRGSVRIDQDSSGDVVVNDVGSDFTLVADGSGDVRHSRVRGNVQVPD